MHEQQHQKPRDSHREDDGPPLWQQWCRDNRIDPTSPRARSARNHPVFCSTETDHVSKQSATAGSTGSEGFAPDLERMFPPRAWHAHLTRKYRANTKLTSGVHSNTPRLPCVDSGVETTNTNTGDTVYGEEDGDGDVDDGDDGQDSPFP